VLLGKKKEGGKRKRPHKWLGIKGGVVNVDIGLQRRDYLVREVILGKKKKERINKSIRRKVGAEKRGKSGL